MCCTLSVDQVKSQIEVVDKIPQDRYDKAITRLIKADGTETPVAPKDGKVFTVGEVMDYLGGSFAAISIKEHKKAWVMLINDSAEALPLNGKASLLSPGVEVIYGTVLICRDRQLGS